VCGVVEHIHTSPGGLPKLPVPSGQVGKNGIEGDGHAHPQFHGGPRKALLLITSEAIEELAAAGFQVFPGALGENLTVRGLDRRLMRLGQRYSVGSVVLELTTMRAPCGALDRYGREIRDAVYDVRVKAGDFASPKWGLGGFYAAVIQPGDIRRQDIIALAE
jgi:MOSC domain-containing protein YiiM